MAPVCAQCHQPVDEGKTCPRCQPASFSLGNASRTPEPSGQWQKTAWGKIAVGLLLAQGLGYGLNNLMIAGLFVAGNDDFSAEAIWKTLWCLVVLHALQAVSLLLGGALSGAGQRYGALCGCCVGLVNGLITLAWQRRDAYSEILVYSIPALHIALGSLGGLAGSLIWRPTPHLPTFEPAGRAGPISSLDTGSLFSSQLLAGPLHLGRVSIGVCVVVFGVVWSNAILACVLHVSQLTVSSHLQARLIGWEISGLAMLFGAGFAGASSFNGFKQGVGVGMGACVLIAGSLLNDPKLLPETLALVLFGTMSMCAAGGWFGAQLLPPVLQGKRRRFSSMA